MRVYRVSDAGPRFPWLRALGTFAVLGALATAGWLAAPWYVCTRILPGLWAQYGLTMVVDRQAASILDGSADFHGVRLLDGAEEILTAKTMQARISWRGLYAGRTIVERLIFDDPVIHARIDADGRTNLGKILERRRVDAQAVQRPATLWAQVFVHGGTLECADPPRAT